MFYKAVKVCRYQLGLSICNPKTAVICLLMFGYIRGMMASIIDFAVSIQLSVNQWIFPVLMSSNVFPVIFLLGFIFLICDAPFINDAYLHIVSAAGKAAWVIGEFMYIAVAAFLYLVINFIFAVVNGIPHMVFASGDDWGKVIGTLTYTGAGTVYHIPFSFESGMVGKYLPGEAMIKTAGLTFMVIVLVGSLIFFLNYVCKQGVGIIIGIGIAVLDITISNFLPLSLRRFSPVSLCRLSLFEGRGWEEYHAFWFLLEGILLESVIFLIYIKKKKGIRC